MTLEQVLAACLRSTEVLTVLSEAVVSDLVVANPYYRQLFTFVTEFHREHRAIPRPGDIELWTGGLPEAQKAGLLESYRRLSMEDTSAFTPVYLANEAITDLKQVAAHTVVSRLSAAQGVTPEVVAQLSEQLNRIGAVSIDGLADLKEVRKWLTADYRETYHPTGIHGLDAAIGGAGVGDLLFFFADAGKGKTTMLLNIGKGCALYGARVLHVTFEVQTIPLLRRYYRSITESDQGRLRNEVELVVKDAEHWLRFAKGSVHVLYQPAYSLTPEDARVLVDRFVQLHGGVDVIIWDYIDLFASSKKVQQRSLADQTAHTSHTLRSFGTIFNAATATATQSVRSASGAERLKMSDVATSYGMVRAADVLVGLVSTDDEAAAMQARLQVLKVREHGGRGLEIPLYFNQDLMLAADLDHPNTIRLMRRLGHLPAPIAAQPMGILAAV